MLQLHGAGCLSGSNLVLKAWNIPGDLPAGLQSLLEGWSQVSEGGGSGEQKE